MHKLKGTRDRRVFCDAVFLLIVLLQMGLVFFWMTRKTSFFLDELYSFGGAQAYADSRNNSVYIHDSPVWKFGEWVENRVLKDQLRVSAEESLLRLPPLKALKQLMTRRNYYGILNILLSVFAPDSISGYPAILFNILILFFTQLLLYRIAEELTGSNSAAVLAVLMYGFSTMAVSMALYVRFYTFSLFLVLAAIRLHQMMWRTQTLWIYELQALSSMALLYFAVKNSELAFILTGALFFFFLLGLLVRKQRRKALCYGITVVLPCLIYSVTKTNYLRIILNPAAYSAHSWPLNVMTESVLTMNPNTFFFGIITVLKLLANLLFGSKYILFGFVGLILFLIVLRLLPGRKAETREDPGEKERGSFFWILLGISAIYTVFAILTSFPADRYYSYLFPLVSILLWSAVVFLTEAGRFRIRAIAVCAALTVCGILSQQALRPNPDYVYAGDRPVFQAIQASGVQDSIVVFVDYGSGGFPEYDCIFVMPDDSRVYAVNSEHKSIDPGSCPDRVLIWISLFDDIGPYTEDLVSGGYDITWFGSTHASDLYLARRTGENPDRQLLSRLRQAHNKQKTGREFLEKENPISISVVVPVYNEEKNIGRLFREIRAVCEAGLDGIPFDYEIIIVNDGSTDQTDRVCGELTPLTYIRFQENCGQTAALDCGFHRAKGDYIAALDGDGQNDPADIPAMLNYLIRNDLDAVSGWRKDRKDSLYRRLLSEGAYRVRQLFLHDGIHDSGCTLKVYRKACFDHIRLVDDQHRLIPAILLQHGFEVREYPVHHRARFSGKSKYRSDRILKGLRDTVWLRTAGRNMAGEKPDPQNPRYRISEIREQ